MVGARSRWQRLDLDVLVVLITAAVLGAPILMGDVLGGHDAFSHLLLGQQQSANLRAGLLLPAWAVDLNAGFGSPITLLYPPLSQYATAAFVLSGLSPLRAIGVAGVAALAASGLAVLAWRQAAGDERGRLCAALIYMAAPYRGLDLYARTALGEHWAFVFPPLALAALAGGGTAGRRIAGSALATAGLVLSSVPQAILCGIALAGWVLFSAEARPHRRDGILGALLGAAIGAMAILPALYAREWLAIELIDASTPRFRPSLNALFSSNTLRLVTSAVTYTALLAAVAFLAAKSRPGRRFWGVTALLTFLSCCPPATLLWDRIPLLSSVQFPWRVAGVLTLAAAALTAALPRGRALLLVAATLLLARSYVVSVIPGETLDRPAVAPARAGSEFPLPQVVREVGGDLEKTRIRNPQLVEPWFRPRWVRPVLLPSTRGAPDPSLGELQQRPAMLSRHADTATELIHWGARGGAVRIEARESDVLLFHQLWFPGMTATLDGRPAVTSPDPDSGLLAVAVPPGSHVVGFGWRPPRALVWARWCSGTALLIALAMLGWPARRLGDGRGVAVHDVGDGNRRAVA